MNLFTVEEIRNLGTFDCVKNIQGGLKGKISEKYGFVSTMNVLSILDKEGWRVRKIHQTNSKKFDGFQKHMVRLIHQDFQKESLHVGDVFTELVMTNSHMGNSSFQFDLGLFRLACSNGMVVCDSMFNTQRVMHKGFAEGKVLDAAYRVIEDSPKVLNAVEKYSKVNLTPVEKMGFAKQSLEIRGINDDINLEETAKMMLIPRRNADINDSLWTTFQICQERLLKGGSYLRKEGTRPYETSKARTIKNINEDLRINKELFELTAKYYDAKVLSN